MVCPRDGGPCSPQAPTAPRPGRWLLSEPTPRPGSLLLPSAGPQEVPQSLPGPFHPSSTAPQLLQGLRAGQNQGLAWAPGSAHAGAGRASAHQLHVGHLIVWLLYPDIPVIPPPVGTCRKQERQKPSPSSLCAGTSELRGPQATQKVLPRHGQHPPVGSGGPGGRCWVPLPTLSQP